MAAASEMDGLRLRTLIRNMHSGVMLEDENRRVIEVNQCFCDLFGIPAPPEALIGMDCAAAADQTKQLFADPEGFVSEIEDLLTRRAPVRGVDVQLADGRVLCRDYEPVIFDGDYRGHYWVYRDVTAERRVNIELRDARDAALAAVVAKSTFLANMSHEIRTPLNAVLGLSEILSKTDLDDEQATLLRSARGAGQTLLALLNDILDMSKLDAGAVTLERRPVAMADLIASMHSMFDLRAREKNVAFEAVVDDDVPPCISGDETRISQMLINLIGNAIKFTSEGFVRLHVSWGEELVFRIQDTGIGIPADRLKTIFDPFSQADTSTTRTHGGTGLGLSITRELASLMGGEVHVASQVGEGSTFTVSVPLPQADEASPKANSTGDTADVDLSGAKVLLVDDNQLNRLVGRRMLEALGCVVTEATDGEEAVAIAEAGGHDLILMDGQMPRMDGFEATREIRRREAAGERVPIVAMTAMALDGDRERCIEAGMDAYLAKPIRVQDLVEVASKFAVGRHVAA